MPTATKPKSYYLSQAATRKAVIKQVNALWRQVDPKDIDTSLAKVRGRIITAIAAGQVRAAQNSIDYLAHVVKSEGHQPQRIYVLNPAGYAGITANGYDLDTVVTSAQITTKLRISQGWDLDQAMLSGGARLLSRAGTEVADTGRMSMTGGIAAQPQTTEYQRIVEAPACDRCIILAGRIYRWSTGFERHPQCDCAMTPLVVGGDSDDSGVSTDPDALFNSMTTEEQDDGFGPANAKAIRSGADISSVVNSKSGMHSPGDLHTTQGRRKPGQAARLSPAGCLAQANGDEEKYLTALRHNGYVR